MSTKVEPSLTGLPRECKIADALSVIGERWSLLIIRELHFGVCRFDEIQAKTGASRETLAARLRKLEACGVIARRQYSEHPPRYEYRLTESGADLLPVLASLREWGEKHTR